MKWTVGITAVAVLLAIGAVPASAVTDEEFSEEADAVCEDYQPEIDDLLDRANSVRTDRGRANVLDDTASLLRDLSRDLSRVEVPAKKRKRFRNLRRALRAVAHYYARAADRYRQGRRKRAIRDVKRGIRASARGARLADGLELYACGSGY